MMQIDETILSRKSVRRFLSDPIPKSVVEHILRISSHAPSVANTQPWQVHVASGKVLDALCDAVYTAAESGGSHLPEFSYYPDEWSEPYLSRRRQMGFRLYEKAGIERNDKEGRRRQMLRNYRFFGAPVGMIVTMDRRLQAGGFLGVAMFIQNITLAARGQGLHTCVQNSFADYHEVIRRYLPINTEEMVLCGIALGHEDSAAAENHLDLKRAAVGEFAAFYGFADA